MIDVHIVNYKDTIIPVITKCKPKIDYDLDIIMNEIVENLEKHLQSMNNCKRGKLEEEDQMILNEFAYKFRIFDPLDREFGE